MCIRRQKKRQKYRSFDDEDVWEMESNRRFKSAANRHARLGLLDGEAGTVRTSTRGGVLVQNSLLSAPLLRRNTAECHATFRYSPQKRSLCWPTALSYIVSQMLQALLCIGSQRYYSDCRLLRFEMCGRHRTRWTERQRCSSSSTATMQ